MSSLVFGSYAYFTQWPQVHIFSKKNYLLYTVRNVQRESGVLLTVSAKKSKTLSLACSDLTVPECNLKLVDGNSAKTG